MKIRYYTNLLVIDDIYRKKKYNDLLIASLKNDMNKWEATYGSFIDNSGDNIERTKYASPDYNGNSFVIECHTKNSKWPNINFAYVFHDNLDKGELIINDDFTGEIKTYFFKLKETVFTVDIYEIEKLVGKNNRKEKLESIEAEQIKPLIEDTYNDWVNNQNEINAKMIAKIIYAYHRNEKLFNLWKEKFDIEIINKELIKLIK